MSEPGPQAQPAQPRRTGPPLNPALRKLIEGKRKWHRPERTLPLKGWVPPLPDESGVPGPTPQLPDKSGVPNRVADEYGVPEFTQPPSSKVGHSFGSPFLGWHERGYLPHFDAPYVTQFVTFMLDGAFPVNRRREWEQSLPTKRLDPRLRVSCPARVLSACPMPCFWRNLPIMKQIAINSWTRRDFTKTLVLAGATTALGSLHAAGANDRVRLGFIGLGNRGDQVLDAFLKQPDADVVALCDLSTAYMDFAAKKIGGSPKQYRDYRQLLDSRDLDAVVIATPDHWHALQTIQACEAGKDVYVEKPLSLCVAEGRRMVEAVHKHKRVSQVGIHRRSVPMCREATDFVRQGGLGKITAARSFHIQNEWPAGIGNPPDENSPPGFDWDAWLGPAPQKQYNKNRTYYRFRWFYDYSGGQVTNFGVHYIDFIQWALGAEAPRSVMAMGNKSAGMTDNREIPDTLEAVWQYPDGVLVTFSQFNANAGQWSLPGCDLELRGTLGTLYLIGDSYQVVPDAISEDEFPARTPLTRESDSRYRKNGKPRIEPRKVRGASAGETTFHARNFLDCVKSRAKCNCDIETGHRSTSATLLANIAYKTRSLLDWDAQAERFTNSEKANALLSYQYRAPYRLP